MKKTSSKSATSTKKKILVKGNATVMVPVTLRFSMMVNADSDANIKDVVRKLIAGENCRQAEQEFLGMDRVVDVNGYTDGTRLEDIAEEIFEDGDFKFSKWKIVKKSTCMSGDNDSN